MQRIAHGDPRVKRAASDADQRARLLAANARLVVMRHNRVAAKESGLVSAEAAPSLPRASRPRHSIQIEVLSEPTAAPPNPETIRAHPSILTALLREEMVATGRLWLLCRHLDQQGRGWVAVDELRTELTASSGRLRLCGWRRLRQLLQAGKGRLWDRDDVGRLWLYGTRRVARLLQLDRLEGELVEIPICDLTQKIGHVRACFYASFHAGRKRAMPISRERLQTITGVAPRTQRGYDAQISVERTSNFALVESADENIAWQHGRAAFRLGDGRGKDCWARRLPNSYRAPFEQHLSNNRKRLNRQLRTDLVGNRTQGNDAQTFRQLFFDDGRRAARVSRQNHDVLIRQQEQKRYAVWIEVRAG